MARSYIVEKCPHCGRSLRQRSLEQNAKLHALLQDIAGQMKWAGQWLDLEDWKRLLTAGWCRANQEHVRIFPCVDGAGMDVLYRRTSRMTKEEMSEFIEYATAWAIEKGIKLQESPEPQASWPEGAKAA
jgi:hypothetical protein